MTKLVNATTAATYEDSVVYIAGMSARAQPDVNVIRLLAWQFNVPQGEVIRDLISQWSRQRKHEQTDRTSSGQKSRRYL